MTFRFTPSDDVRHAIADGILTVTIDRAEKRNPLSLGVLDSLRRLFTGLAGDPAIRLAVITGAGDKAFASGGDLGELAGYRSREDAEAFSRHGKAALDAIRTFPVPVIARINGYALGGGCELALACDQRLAAGSARLGMIHGRLAISPSWGGGNDLVRLLGPARALRLMVDAATLTAEQAAAAGLVDAVCPVGEDFAAWFEDRLEPWRAHPRQVMRAFKAIAAGAPGANRAALDAAETHHFAEAWSHDDHWAAVAARARSG
ncbi:MAG: enoyl-CoA hydratase/isomerase family protein [Sphingomonadales bacterium]|nr:enoyl-CoA hydratase/isomerase family protein [Sphingomonadales bacterium]